jgi:hypothetical protein
MSSADRIGRLGVESASSDARATSEQIATAIAGLRYGTVEITIHDGQITQIERTEKIRLQDDLVRGRGRST